jgi:hypothetical protein
MLKQITKALLRRIKIYKVGELTVQFWQMNALLIREKLIREG